MAKKKEIKSFKKDLVFTILYFVCSILWFIGSANKIIIKESYLFDLIVAIILFILSVIYLVKYIKSNK